MSESHWYEDAARGDAYRDAVLHGRDRDLDAPTAADLADEYSAPGGSRRVWPIDDPWPTS